MEKWATGPRRRLAKILKSQHTVTLWCTSYQGSDFREILADFKEHGVPAAKWIEHRLQQGELPKKKIAFQVSLSLLVHTHTHTHTHTHILSQVLQDLLLLQLSLSLSLAHTHTHTNTHFRYCWTCCCWRRQTDTCCI